LSVDEASTAYATTGVFVDGLVSAAGGAADNQVDGEVSGLVLAGGLSWAGRKGRAKIKKKKNQRLRSYREGVLEWTQGWPMTRQYGGFGARDDMPRSFHLVLPLS
jgi:hypothetical protein